MIYERLTIPVLPRLNVGIIEYCSQWHLLYEFDLVPVVYGLHP